MMTMLCTYDGAMKSYMILYNQLSNSKSIVALKSYLVKLLCSFLCCKQPLDMNLYFSVAMGRKLSLCSRKYRDQKKKTSPVQVIIKVSSGGFNSLVCVLYRLALVLHQTWIWPRCMSL